MDMNEETKNKIALTVELQQMAGRVAQAFGQQKAAQMLRGAAAMVAPERQPRAPKAKK